MEKLKISLRFTALLMAISFMATGCQKEDLTKPEETQTLHPANPVRVQIKMGNDVSKKAKAFLKEKTNNSFRIALQNKGIVLSKSNGLAKETSFGTINTEKEIVVVNETNTKHTFKVETVNQDDSSIINVIVVETPDGVYEYFMKYTFVGIKPYLPDGTFDISRFTGTIETYNRSGTLTSIITFDDGDIVDNEVDGSPCPEDDLWDGWDDYWDDNDGGSGGGSSSGSGTNDGSGNTTGSGGTSSGSGSGSGGGGNNSCGLSYHYECNAGYEGSHPPAENPSMPGGMCSGAGPGHGGVLVVTSCNEVIATSDNLNRSSYGRSSGPNPCDEGITGVLIDADGLKDSIEECLGMESEWLDNEATYTQIHDIAAYLDENQCSEETQEIIVEFLENVSAYPFPHCSSFEYSKPPGVNIRACAVTNLTETFYAYGEQNGQLGTFVVTAHYSIVFFTMPIWMTNGQAATNTAIAVQKAFKMTKDWFYVNYDATEAEIQFYLDSSLIQQMGLFGGTKTDIPPFNIPSPAPYITSLFGTGNCN